MTTVLKPPRPILLDFACVKLTSRPRREKKMNIVHQQRRNNVAQYRSFLAQLVERVTSNDEWNFPETNPLIARQLLYGALGD
ncbi:hypothetical protein D9756_010359 [Leucocoprinus leucothites]|uniref:Uncharacterized protein n=1 Tax=Leucocoprinus leucothites TaxID=201217 RepID=A0A8H5CRX8_9AGAR|nr:hypothetical protein D9756_010359 [Leucoagaricus leucothites]